MHQVAQEDVLLALKKFKRLAKQDLLASPLMSDPKFWEEHATARRAVYEELMRRVEEEGVEPAYREAKKRYQALPLVASTDRSHPRQSGEEQALEMFFTILGITGAELEELRSARPPAPLPSGTMKGEAAGADGQHLVMEAGGA